MRTLTYSLLLLITLSLFIVVGIIITAFLVLTRPTTAVTNYTTPSISNNPPAKYSHFVTSLFIKDGRDMEQDTPETFSNWQNSENIKYDDYAPSSSGVVVSGGTLESTPTQTKESPSASKIGFDIWSWLPTSKSNTQKVVGGASPTTIAIKDYANTLGEAIKAFTTEAGDQPKILQDFIEKRDDVGTNNALMALGESYLTLSKELESVAIDALIPIDIQQRGDDLLRAYAIVGEATKNLANIRSMNDEDTIAALYTYNAQIDTFAKDYLAFVTIIGAYGVTFTQGEGGDIFMLLR